MKTVNQNETVKEIETVLDLNTIRTRVEKIKAGWNSETANNARRRQATSSLTGTHALGQQRRVQKPPLRFQLGRVIENFH